MRTLLADLCNGAKSLLRFCYDPTVERRTPLTNIDLVRACGPVEHQRFPRRTRFGKPGIFRAAAPGAFPQTPPPTGQAITWGIDQSIKTPYAYAFDFSVGRELPKGFSAALVRERLGRNLLTQRDLRQPIDIVDPKTGIDYFSAATALAKVARPQCCPVATGTSFESTLPRSPT